MVECEYRHKDYAKFCKRLMEKCSYCNYEVDFDKLNNLSPEQQELLNKTIIKYVNSYYNEGLASILRLKG